MAHWSPSHRRRPPPTTTDYHDDGYYETPIMSVAPLDTTDRPDTTDSLPIDDRDRRALLEALVVEPLAPGMFRVRGESGAEYVVDVDGGACTCPDFQYRAVECKHLRRARLEAGETDPDALASRIDAGIETIDDRLGALAARRADLVRLRASLDRFE